ncbi:MAG: DUF952 domain-containing protein [Pseudomonadota bacterium]
MSIKSNKMIYKICTRQEWQAALELGSFQGAAVDLADGFIHFSAAHQVQQTAAKHFRGQTDLLLVAVSADDLGDALKWERSRGGDLFPHLYGALKTELARWEEPLVSDHEGVPFIPGRVAPC